MGRRTDGNAPVANIYYVDGEFVASDSAQLPADDLGILRGYGVFDFTRTYGGRPFRLDAHLQRLQRSAQHILLELPLPPAQIRAIALETLARNALPAGAEAGLRIVLTGGSSPDFITPAGPSRLLVLVSPLRRPPADWFREGVRVISNPLDRYLPAAKTINYAPAIVALRRARQAGAVEAIYINRRGHALEGTTTNLFAIFGNRLLTPAAEVLAGVTRQVVLELAATTSAATEFACSSSRPSCPSPGSSAPTRSSSPPPARKSAPSPTSTTPPSAAPSPAPTHPRPHACLLTIRRPRPPRPLTPAAAVAAKLDKSATL